MSKSVLKVLVLEGFKDEYGGIPPSVVLRLSNGSDSGIRVLDIKGEFSGWTVRTCGPDWEEVQDVFPFSLYPSSSATVMLQLRMRSGYSASSDHLGLNVSFVSHADGATEEPRVANVKCRILNGRAMPRGDFEQQ